METSLVANNHRPITLATIISKLLESILLIKCEEYLCTSANSLDLRKRMDLSYNINNINDDRCIHLMYTIFN